jgi:hypothetical protein
MTDSTPAEVTEPRRIDTEAADTKPAGDTPEGDDTADSTATATPAPVVSGRFFGEIVAEQGAWAELFAGPQPATPAAANWHDIHTELDAWEAANAKGCDDNKQLLNAWAALAWHNTYDQLNAWLAVHGHAPVAAAA